MAACKIPAALTIAGSDSGGGAGIQADLKTFEALGVFGTTALTCVTAQNPRAVTGIAALTPDMVKRQIAAVLEVFPVRAAKTGMLYSRQIINAVAELWQHSAGPSLVVDPVLVAASGAPLLRPDAVTALRERLISLATVITPNVPEAELLLGHEIRHAGEALSAVSELRDRYGVAALLKGGHLKTGRTVLDFFAPKNGPPIVFSRPRLRHRETHGCGCTLSAAVTAYLALGRPLTKAVQLAGDFVAAALSGARRIGKHRPLNFSAGAPRDSE